MFTGSENSGRWWRAENYKACQNRSKTLTPRIFIPHHPPLQNLDCLFSHRALETHKHNRTQTFTAKHTCVITQVCWTSESTGIEWCSWGVGSSSGLGWPSPAILVSLHSDLTNGMKQWVGIYCNCSLKFWPTPLFNTHTHRHANAEQVISDKHVQMAEAHKTLSDPSAPWRDLS